MTKGKPDKTVISRVPVWAGFVEAGTHNLSISNSDVFDLGV